jgi:chromosome segregation ATPase
MIIYALFSDEFDVFMDSVNRRISMKMMVSRTPWQIDTANASDKKQYILITPLSVNMEIGKTVRVHKMVDPERGQGTLSFKN